MKRFLKTTMIFLTGSIMSKLVNVFLIPLYTAYLSPAQFGEYDLAISFVNLFAPIAFLQIWDGMFRFAFDFEGKNKIKVINNSAIVYLVGVLVYFILLFPFLKLYGFNCILLVLLYGLFLTLQYVYTFSARLYLKNKLFAFSGFINTVISALLNILFIKELGWGIESLYLASIIGMLVQIIIIELNIHIVTKFSFRDYDKSLIRDMIKFSVPLCLSTISYWAFSGYTKVIISSFLGESANGIYAVANRFAYMVNIVISVFQYAWNESAYLMGQNDNRKESYKTCFDIIIKCVSCGLTCLMIAVKILFPFLVAEQYSEALMFIPVTMFGVAMNALAGFTATFFMTEKKTGHILKSSLISAFVNVISGIVLTKHYGLFGATFALSISLFIMMLMRSYKFAKMFEATLVKKYIFMFLMVSSATSVFYLVDSLILNLLFCIVSLIVFVISMRGYLKSFFQKTSKK